MEIIEILYNNKLYKIRKDKLIYVLNRLSNDDISVKDEKTILKMMNEYCLIDDIFLESLIKTNIR